jgi:hypothetical protein
MKTKKTIFTYLMAVGLFLTPTLNRNALAEDESSDAGLWFKPTHSTTERCSGQLTVEDGFGVRWTIQRGYWYTINNGYRRDLQWFCGSTAEVTRNVYSPNVSVFHSLNDRKITINW